MDDSTGARVQLQRLFNTIVREHLEVWRTPLGEDGLVTVPNCKTYTWPWKKVMR